MEPRIQYAKTRDGVTIACYTQGEGRPFIEMPPIPVSLASGHSRIPQWQAWNEQIAQRAMFIRYDCRGAGMSDRDVNDYSLDAWLLDLETVVDSLGLPPFTLFAGNSLAVPVAIAYGARWPARVSHLVLWQAHTRGSHLTGHPGFAATLDLMERDWKLFSETLAHVTEGWAESEMARREAALIRENQTPRGLRAALTAASGIDVSGLLSEIRSPTLVLHRRGRGYELGESRRVASEIPNARLVVVEGSSTSWSLQHPEAVLRAIDEFRSSENGSGRSAVRLSAREVEVLRLLAEGRSTREIGLDLVLTVRTVERHITNIYRKIDAHNRAQATAFALHHGLTSRS